MIKLYRKIENRWFGLPQKIRFLLVGGFNTFLAYLLFVLFISTKAQLRKVRLIPFAQCL